MAKLKWKEGDHDWVAHPREYVVATAEMENGFYEIRCNLKKTFDLLHRGMTVNRKPLKSRELCEKLAQAIEDAVEQVEA